MGREEGVLEDSNLRHGKHDALRIVAIEGLVEASDRLPCRSRRGIVRHRRHGPLSPFPFLPPDDGLGAGRNGSVSATASAIKSPLRHLWRNFGRSVKMDVQYPGARGDQE